MGTSCAYRLYGSFPPSQERIKIIATAPQEYVLSVDTGEVTEIKVPADGRVLASVPTYRPRCGVYLFNEIKVSGGGAPLKNWHVSATHAGRTVRTLSLRQVRDLPVDEAGYHLQKLSK
jgi:hypothetical protein